MITDGEIQTLLESNINRTPNSKDWRVYFVKELMKKIRNMKIELYLNDHNPPNFYVKSINGDINAKSKLDNCELIKG